VKKNNKIDTTLIVPAAGKSSRYPGVRPKWMLTHPDGSLMIEKVIKSFNYMQYKETCIVILREHCEKFDAEIVLDQAFGNTIRIIILEKETRSCPETISNAIEIGGIKGSIIVKDTDCIVEIENQSPVENFVVGLEITSRSNISNIQNKSFIVKNDDNIVTDIVEKIIVSDIICLGVYCLDCDDFLRSYERLLNTEIVFNSAELYMSHIISDLIINDKMLFHERNATKYIDWGTHDEWQYERDKYKTYIFDIDGVVLKNFGKYGKNNWDNTFIPIVENVEKIKELSDAGNEIIFMTSRPEKYLANFKKYLKSQDIKYKTIISGCNHSQRIIVNDFAKTNQYPSCQSISIKRNGSLKDYI